MHHLTIPEQVDQAITNLIERRPAPVGAALAGEVETARLIRDGLSPVPLSERFELDLARRLANPGPLGDLPLPRVIRHHWRLALATATVAAGSVAIGLAGALYAVWRQRSGS